MPKDDFPRNLKEYLFINKFDEVKREYVKVKLYKYVSGVYYINRNVFPQPNVSFNADISRVYIESRIKEVNFKASLREYQKTAVQDILNKYQENLNTDVFFKAPCGAGKTVMALAVFAQLGVKTFVTVPNTKLRDQWVKEIKSLTSAKVVTYTKSQHAKALKADIVVSTVQSVMKSEQDFSSFSLLIVDEAHGSAAEVWSESIPKFSGRRLLITATPSRPDGLSAVLESHCGPVSVSIENETLRKLGYVLTPVVLFLHHKKDYDYRIPYDRDRTDLNRVYNKMASDLPRCNFILDKVKKYAAKGHDAVFISKRVALTEWFHENMPDCSILTGKKKDDELKRHISGSEAIVKEGLDHPTLSLAVFCTPIGNISMYEQAMGRVSRVSENKLQPFIIDIVDTSRDIVQYYRGEYGYEKTYTEAAFSRRVSFAKRLGMRTFIESDGKVTEV